MTTIEKVDLHAGADSMQLESRSERLRLAVRAAGGNQIIAQKAGVPLSTLGSYLAGGEQKLSNTIALAKACGVSLEWLATGEGPMRPGETPPQPPPPPPQTGPKFLKAFGTMNVDALAECLEAVLEQFHSMGVPNPDWRGVVQATLLLYDELLAARAREEEHDKKS